VLQYNDIVQATQFKEDQAFMISGETCILHSMLDIITQTQLSIIDDGMCYGAGSSGKKVHQRTHEVLHEKGLRNVIQPLSISINCRRISVQRLTNNKITDQVASSLLSNLNSIATIHMPSTYLSKTTFAIVRLLHIGKSEDNSFNEKCDVTKESEDNLMENYYKKLFIDDNNDILGYTEDDITDKNFDLLHENKEIVKPSYPHMILYEKQKCLYRTEKGTDEDNEGCYMVSKYVNFFLHYVHSVKNFEDNEFNGLCKILYFCGNKKKQFLMDDGKQQNKFHILRNVIMQIFRHITGKKDTNKSNDDLIYVLVEFIRSAIEINNHNDTSTETKSMIDHLKKLLHYIKIHLPTYENIRSDFWNLQEQFVRATGTNKYNTEFRMVKSIFYGNNHASIFKDIMPVKIVLWSLASSINNFAITMIDGNHSTVQLLRYYLRGFTTSENSQQAYLSYIPMDKTGTTKEIKKRYEMQLNLSLVEPGYLCREKIESGQSSEMIVFRQESSFIQHNSSANNRPKENVSYVIEFIEYLLQKVPDIFDFYQKYLTINDRNDLTGDSLMVPFNCHVSKYGEARKTNKNIYSNRLANHSRTMQIIIRHMLDFVDTLNSTDQFKLLGTRTLNEIKQNVINIYNTTNARFLLQEAYLQANVSKTIKKEERLFSNQFGHPRDVAYQGIISTTNKTMRDIGKDANYDALYAGGNEDGSFELASSTDIAKYQEHFVSQKNSFLSALLGIIFSITNSHHAKELKESLKSLCSYSIHGKNDLSFGDINDLSSIINSAKIKQYLVMMGNYKDYDKNNSIRKVDEIAFHIERTYSYWTLKFIMHMIHNYELTDCPFETAIESNIENRASVKEFLKKVNTRLYEYQGKKHDYIPTDLHDFGPDQYIKLIISYIVLHDYIPDNQQRNLHVQYEMEMIQRVTSKRGGRNWMAIPPKFDWSPLYDLRHRSSVLIENYKHALKLMPKLNISFWNETPHQTTQCRVSTIEEIFNICPDNVINKCDSTHLIETQIDPYTDMEYFYLSESVGKRDVDGLQQIKFNNNEFEYEKGKKLPLEEFAAKVIKRQVDNAGKKGDPTVLGTSLVTVKNQLGQILLTTNEVYDTYLIDLLQSGLKYKQYNNGKLFHTFDVSKNLKLEDKYKNSQFKEYIMYLPAMLLNGGRILQHNIAITGNLSLLEASLEIKKDSKQKHNCYPTIQSLYQFRTMELPKSLQDYCINAQNECFGKEWTTNMGKNNKKQSGKQKLTTEETFENLINKLPANEPTKKSMNQKLLVLDPSNFITPKDFSTTKERPNEVSIYHLIHDNIVESRDNFKIDMLNLSDEIKKSFKNKMTLNKLLELRKKDTNDWTNVLKYMTCCSAEDFANAKNEVDQVFDRWIERKKLGNKIHDILGSYKQICSHLILGPQKLYEVGTDILKFYHEHLAWTYLYIVQALIVNGITHRENPIEKFVDLRGYDIMNLEMLRIFGMENAFRNMANSISKRLGKNISCEKFIRMCEVIDFYQYRYYCKKKSPELTSGNKEDFVVVLSSDEYKSYLQLKNDIYMCCSYDFTCGDDNKTTFLEAKNIEYVINNNQTEDYKTYYEKTDLGSSYLCSKNWFREVYNAESVHQTTHRLSAFERLTNGYKDISRDDVKKLTSLWYNRQEEIEKAILIKPAPTAVIKDNKLVSPRKKGNKSKTRSSADGSVGLDEECCRASLYIPGSCKFQFFCEKNASISQASMKNIFKAGLVAMQKEADKQAKNSNHSNLEIAFGWKPNNIPRLIGDNQDITLESVTEKVSQRIQYLEENDLRERKSYPYLLCVLHELSCKNNEDKEDDYFKEIFNYVLNDENDNETVQSEEFPTLENCLNAIRESNIDGLKKNISFYEKCCHVGLTDSKYMLFANQSWTKKYNDGETTWIEKHRNSTNRHPTNDDQDSDSDRDSDYNEVVNTAMQLAVDEAVVQQLGRKCDDDDSSSTPVAKNTGSDYDENTPLAQLQSTKNAVKSNTSFTEYLKNDNDNELSDDDANSMKAIINNEECKEDEVDNDNHQNNLANDTHSKRKRTSVAKKPSEVIQKNFFSDSDKSSEDSDDSSVFKSKKKRKRFERVIQDSDEDEE